MSFVDEPAGVSTASGTESDGLRPRPIAAALSCPALVLYGGADDAVPVAESVTAFAAALPGLGEGLSEIAVFPDGNHGLHVADPDPAVPRRDQLVPGLPPMLPGFLAAVHASG